MASCMRHSTGHQLFKRSVNKLSCQVNYAAVSGNHVMSNLDSNTGVAEVKLNKPPVNSLNLEFLQELTQTIKDLESNKGCRGLILTSNVPKIFSAGLDIMEMYKPKVDRMSAFWTALQEMWMTLYGSKLATVAAITGHAPAGGCMMALSCDYRIMVNDKASIGMNETLLGIVAPPWFQEIMLNTIGHRRTEYALSLGAMFKPDQALKINMVDELAASPEAVLKRAQEEISNWIQIPSYARQMTKKSLRQPTIERLKSQRDADVKNFVTFASAEKTQQALGFYMETLKKKK